MTNLGKTILVTGATGGIGKAVCQYLADNEYSLVLAGRDVAKMEASCASLPSGNQGVFSFIQVDMSDDESVKSFGNQLKEKNIVLDGVVLMPPQLAPTKDCLPSNETWRQTFQTSFIGPLSLLKVAIESMRPDPLRAKRSKIVIISGISSAQVLEHYATSNVLRCAWLAEAKTLAFALGERGIHVNTLSLGGTLTDKYRAGIEKRASDAGVSFETRLAEETSNVPLKKYGSPREVAVAVEGLLGRMSDHMTGVNLMHDGGFTKSY